jgi:hypothetical protein
MPFLLKGELPITPALVCLLVANLADAIATLVLMQAHGADELNPILAHAYHRSPLTFMGLKLGLVFMSILATWLIPSHRRITKCWLIRFGAAVYLVVLI